MVKVYLGLGANLGNPLETVKRACEKLRVFDGGLRVSKFYQTKPVSSIPQPDFINCAVELETEMSAEKLFLALEAIEIALGKKKKGKEEPRHIDIDILFYGDYVIENEVLTVPHSKWKERLFVLEPLLDLGAEISVAGKRVDLVKCMERLL